MQRRSLRGRFVVPILVMTAGAIGASRASAYVLPVTDVFNWIRNQAIALQTEWQVDILDQQSITMRKMARRLSEYVGDLHARFAVKHDDPPRWRIHDFESDRYLYGRSYGAALNYGDASGEAVDTISRPAPTLSALPTALVPAARRDVESALATIEIADAVLRDGTHQSGLLRYGSRSLHAAAGVFERDALDGDVAQSTSAGLDKLNAAAVLELKQQQGRNDLLVVALELAILANKRQRDAETIAMNQRLRAKQHYRSYASAFFSPASLAASSRWRQP